MKKPVKSNMYCFSLDHTWDEFGDFVEGNKLAPLCVLSYHPLAENARAALYKSCESFEYGSDACMFVTARPSEGIELSAEQVLQMIEGVDPYRLVIADEEAARLCSSGYHRPVPFDEYFTLLERPVVAFRSLSKSIESEKGKHLAWKLLKKLLRVD